MTYFTYWPEPCRVFKDTEFQGHGTRPSAICICKNRPQLVPKVNGSETTYVLHTLNIHILLSCYFILMEYSHTIGKDDSICLQSN